MLPIISASRRTDLPRAFSHVLASWLRQGRVRVRNPYNQSERLVSLAPDQVHSIVLWSKDFSALLQNHSQLLDALKSYDQLFFHFTVTGMGGTKAEPGIAPYKKAISQFEKLVKLAGNERRVNWRFDPVLFWKEAEGIKSNVELFEMIAKPAASAGIKTMTFSICHWYQKSIQRAKLYGFPWINPDENLLKRALEHMLEKANKIGLMVQSCCCPQVILPGISKAKCIDGELLSKLHPKGFIASSRKDDGQRKDCGCSKSIDIGGYQYACDQGCVYCYANPKSIAMQ